MAKSSTRRKHQAAKKEPAQEITPVTCMPRSGSTLLMNMLGQNPAHHVTPTNDLVQLVLAVRDRWTQTPGFKSQGLLKTVKPRVLTSMKGLLRGFYEKELAKNKRVFDKSRGWIHHLGMLDEIFDRRVKVLTTIRDIRDVVASMEKVHRKSLVTETRPLQGEEFFDHQTIYGRAKIWLEKGGVIGQFVHGLRDALNSKMGDRIQFIPYRALTAHPKETMAKIHEFLEIPPFEYDPDSVSQITEEDDSVHGMALHVIRPKVEPEGRPGWIGILPKDLAQKLDEGYKDINELADIGE